MGKGYIEVVGYEALKMATYRNAISILLSNALGFCLALLEWVLVLELGTHGV